MEEGCAPGKGVDWPSPAFVVQENGKCPRDIPLPAIICLHVIMLVLLLHPSAQATIPTSDWQERSLSYTLPLPSSYENEQNRIDMFGLRLS